MDDRHKKAISWVCVVMKKCYNAISVDALVVTLNLSFKDGWDKSGRNLLFLTATYETSTALE